MMAETCAWPAFRTVVVEQGHKKWSEVERYTRSMGWWNGKPVIVDISRDPSATECAEHDLVTVDHYGHPTELLMCYGCIGFASNPDGAPRCTSMDCWHHDDPEWCNAQQNGWRE